ncbi:hypothetical protein C8R46DRAFT_1186767 [Mycena filopes]|nr:hypothetical protein C8R46DRAFT_1186767 [Mycena filopes]
MDGSRASKDGRSAEKRQDGSRMGGKDRSRSSTASWAACCARGLLRGFLLELNSFEARNLSCKAPDCGMLRTNGSACTGGWKTVELRERKKRQRIEREEREREGDNLHGDCAKDNQMNEEHLVKERLMRNDTVSASEFSRSSPRVDECQGNVRESREEEAARSTIWTMKPGEQSSWSKARARGSLGPWPVMASESVLPLGSDSLQSTIFTKKMRRALQIAEAVDMVCHHLDPGDSSPPSQSNFAPLVVVARTSRGRVKNQFPRSSSGSSLEVYISTETLEKHHGLRCQVD